jgi:hypothetical protein
MLKSRQFARKNDLLQHSEPMKLSTVYAARNSRQTKFARSCSLTGRFLNCSRQYECADL